MRIAMTGGVILAAAVLLTGTIVLRESLRGRLADNAARRRCAAVWLATLALLGVLLAAMLEHGLALEEEWFVAGTATLLGPASLMGYRDYRAVELREIARGTARLALAAVAAAGTVSLLRPYLGDWAWGVPLAAGVYGYYRWLRRQSPPREALLLLLGTVAVLVVLTLIVVGLERIGVRI